MTETRNLHKSQFNKQSLVRRLSYLAIGLGKQRYGIEEETFVCRCRLLAVALNKRTRKLDKSDSRALCHKQVAHMGIQTRKKDLRREALRQYLVKEHQRIDIAATEQHIRNAEVGVVVEDIERCRHILIREI